MLLFRSMLGTALLKPGYGDGKISIAAIKNLDCTFEYPATDNKILNIHGLRSERRLRFFPWRTCLPPPECRLNPEME